MTFQNWWLFVTAVFLLSATPGPNMLHILSRSVLVGVRQTTIAMAGCLSALCMILSASALGLTALLLAVPGAFEVLRYVGAAYLIFLGVKAWRTNEAPIDVGRVEPPRSMRGWRLFRGGFSIGISNPKSLLFAAAFLPQFVNSHAPKAPQFIVLVGTFLIIESFWYFVYAWGGRSISHYLERPTISRIFNRVTGGIFVGFGIVLLKFRES